jgi:hypothetical protein
MFYCRSERNERRKGEKHYQEGWLAHNGERMAVIKHYTRRRAREFRVKKAERAKHFQGTPEQIAPSHANNQFMIFHYSFAFHTRYGELADVYCSAVYVVLPLNCL